MGFMKSKHGLGRK